MRIGNITIERKDLRRAKEYAQTVHWPDVIANRRAQKRHPERKIFMIGPNRCATTSFHKFFHFQGLRSLHCREGDMYLAREIRDRMQDHDALRAFLSGWTVYSDFVYLTQTDHFEAHGLYETFSALFPDAYFILNDRDVDSWIASRLNFKDDFLPRYLSVHGGTAYEAADIWREEFASHRRAALEFFAGHPRFIHFPITPIPDAGIDAPANIEQVIDMISPVFRLRKAHWRPLNAATKPTQPQGG